MNSRDVVHGLLTKGYFDRIGLFEHFWGEVLGLWVQQGYPTIQVVRNGQKVSEPVDLHDHLGLDMQMCWAPLDCEPIRGYQETLDETDEWIINRNGRGAAMKRWKHHSGTPEHIDFLMSSREIWERDYRPHLLGLDRERIAFDRREKLRAKAHAAGRWFYDGCVFVWEEARSSLGDLNLYQSMALDPDWIHDFNRVYTDFYKAHYRVLFEEAGLPDGIWIYEDFGFRGRLFASPRMFRELTFPYEAELVEFFHSYGLPVVLHSCGDITEALGLIVEAGFDALQPMEVKAGCDPLAFAAQYHDQLAFIGGLDIRILETNDRETIKHGVIELMEGTKTRGARYVLHSDHSITPRVHYDSYQYALEIFREHMTY